MLKWMFGATSQEETKGAEVVSTDGSENYNESATLDDAASASKPFADVASDDKVDIGTTGPSGGRQRSGPGSSSQEKTDYEKMLEREERENARREQAIKEIQEKALNKERHRTSGQRELHRTRGWHRSR